MNTANAATFIFERVRVHGRKFRSLTDDDDNVAVYLRLVGDVRCKSYLAGVYNIIEQVNIAKQMWDNTLQCDKLLEYEYQHSWATLLIFSRSSFLSRLRLPLPCTSFPIPIWRDVMAKVVKKNTLRKYNPGGSH